jgi:hypothetical protein
MDQQEAAGLSQQSQLSSTQDQTKASTTADDGLLKAGCCLLLFAWNAAAAVALSAWC